MKSTLLQRLLTSALLLCTGIPTETHAGVHHHIERTDEEPSVQMYMIDGPNTVLSYTSHGTCGMEYLPTRGMEMFD